MEERQPMNIFAILANLEPIEVQDINRECEQLEITVDYFMNEFFGFDYDVEDYIPKAHKG
jgi:hypothetical protein